MHKCPECRAPEGQAHLPGCSIGSIDYAQPPSELPAATLEERQKLGDWARGLSDNPNARAVIELFASEAERRCLKAATSDPAAAQVHAMEVLIARRFLKRLEDFARDGHAAELTIQSLMRQDDTRVTRHPRGRGLGRTRQQPPASA